MKKVENYLETLKLKKCLFGGIAPKQIEIVIQEMNSRTSGWKK